MILAVEDFDKLGYKMIKNENLSPHYKFYYPDLRFITGRGPILTDTNNVSYIDATSGWGVLAFGHCYYAIQEAAINQIQELVHTVGTNIDHEPQNILANEIIKKMPKTHKWKLFFANTGTESVEGAMKLARYHTKRPGFLSFQGGFHGRTFGSMSLGSAFNKLKDGFDPLLSDIGILPYNDPDCFLKVSNGADVAAVFVELVQGVGGCRVATLDFVQAIRNFCDRTGALMIVDEVQTGIGRTGRFWAFEHYNIVPDVVCSAKALGGGFALGAVIAQSKFMNWPAGAHGSTFAGHPVACAAGTVVLRKMNESFLKIIQAKSYFFRQALEAICNIKGYKIGGLGFMLAIDIGDVSKRDEIMAKCCKNELLVLPAEPAAIRLLPPLNCEDKILRKILHVLRISL